MFSGYKKAFYEVAEGKPLELLSSSILLHVLKAHARVEANRKYVDHWKES